MRTRTGLVATVALLALPVAALASPPSPSPADKATASKQCSTELRATGPFA